MDNDWACSTTEWLVHFSVGTEKRERERYKGLDDFKYHSLPSQYKYLALCLDNKHSLEVSKEKSNIWEHCARSFNYCVIWTDIIYQEQINVKWYILLLNSMVPESILWWLEELPQTRWTKTKNQHINNFYIMLLSEM